MDDDTTFPVTSGSHHERGTVAGRLSGELPVAPLQRNPAPSGDPCREQRAGTDPGSTTHRSAGAPSRTRVDLTATNHVTNSHPQHADIPVQRQHSTSEPRTERAPSGLEVFDLGSVPASVTPPRTWRRAAWFATVSSGSVVGLLFAGAFLLGHQPEQDQQAGDGTYLDRNHHPPLIERRWQPTAQQPPPREPHSNDRATGSTTASSTATPPRNSSAATNSAAPSGTHSGTHSGTPHPDAPDAANRPIRATVGDNASSTTGNSPTSGP